MRGGCQYFRFYRSAYTYKGKYPYAWLTKLKAAVRCLSRHYTGDRATSRSRSCCRRKGALRNRWCMGCAVNWAWRLRSIDRNIDAGASQLAFQLRPNIPAIVLSWDFIHDKTIRSGAASKCWLSIMNIRVRFCLSTSSVSLPP